MSTVKVRALVSSMRRERPHLVSNFSKHALTEIAKDEIAKNPRSNNIGFLTVNCIASMENQLIFTLEDQKELLQGSQMGEGYYHVYRALMTFVVPVVIIIVCLARLFGF